MNARSMLRVVALACAVLPAVALAQPKPALIQDRDASARDPYQRVVARAVDSSSGSTQGLLFPAVPTGKRLVVTFISVSLGAPAVVGDSGWAALSRLGGTEILILPPPLLGYDRVVAMPLTYYFEAGEEPIASLQSIGGWPDGSRIQVTLVGYYISLP